MTVQWTVTVPPVNSSGCLPTRTEPREPRMDAANGGMSRHGPTGWCSPRSRLPRCRVISINLHGVVTDTARQLSRAETPAENEAPGTVKAIQHCIKAFESQCRMPGRYRSYGYNRMADV